MLPVLYIVIPCYNEQEALPIISTITSSAATTAVRIFFQFTGFLGVGSLSLTHR